MHTAPHIAGHIAHEIAGLRPSLVRIARQRLRNEAWAEDAVSETLVAALENPGAFAGRARPLTWLAGILKHKLVDQVRRGGRELSIEGVFGGDDEHEPSGYDTIAAEAAWADPQAQLARRQFARQLQAALAELPPQQARAFELRECAEDDTDEVCRAMGVNANHLGVILHRARHKLRGSLAPHAS